MQPYIEELAAISPYYLSAYPNAGLPDPLSETGFPETPESLAPKLGKWAANGWLNLVGGCCGTTPEHIRAIAAAVRDCKPRTRSLIEMELNNSTLQLSGLEPLNITPEMGFVVVGERTNITGSPKFSKLILSDDFEGALAVARQQVQGGANILDVNMDEGMIDSEAAMTRFLNLIGSEPEIARIPTHDRQLEVERDRSRPEMRPGQSGREFDQLEKWRRRISPASATRSAIRRGGHRDGVR